MIYQTFTIILVHFCLVYIVKASTVETLLEMGDKALASENFHEAVTIYNKGINALKLAGDDDSSKGPQQLVTSISLSTNLGSALSSLGQDREAAEAYRISLKNFRDSIENINDNDQKNIATSIASQAAFYLGMVYQDLGALEAAANAYSYANTLDPLHWSSLANLAALLQDHLHQPDDALLAYQKAFEILTQQDKEPTDFPQHPEYMLAELQYRIGNLLIQIAPNRKCSRVDAPGEEASCQELANHALSQALKYDPNHEKAKHMLAALTADATMTRASNKYVKSLFDEYANNFEHSLVKELNYNGFERLRRSFDDAFQGSPPSSKVVIDAGCGTGLVGEQFRNISEYLVGVDLSQAILDEAKSMRPTLYDETIMGDIIEVFSKTFKAKIDLIIAADSYIYFGDLEPLFAAMEKGLTNGGYAAFTLENVDQEDEEILDTTKPDWRWKLTASGRFAHRQKYVEDISRKHHLSVRYYQPLTNFRYENGKGVNGHIFIIQKTKQDQEL